MTDFLTQVAEKHSIDTNTLLKEWESFTGKKRKVKKQVEGPTVKELREKLKSVGLTISGKKQDLINRLADFEAGKIKPKVLEEVKEGSYDGMTVKELKEKCKEKGLKVSGKKSELIERLNESESDCESDCEDESDCETSDDEVEEVN